MEDYDSEWQSVSCRDDTKGLIFLLGVSPELFTVPCCLQRGKHMGVIRAVETTVCQEQVIGPDPSRIEPIKSECFLAQGATRWV